MILVTIKEIMNECPEFVGHTSVRSFIKNRDIVCHGKKDKAGKNGGSAECLYNIEDIKYWLKERPIQKKIYRIKNGKQKGVRPKRLTDEPLLGESQPFRAIDCLYYIECLDNAAKKRIKLKCFMCKQYQKKEFKYYESI